MGQKDFFHGIPLITEEGDLEGGISLFGSVDAWRQTHLLYITLPWQSRWWRRQAAAPYGCSRRWRHTQRGPLASLGWPVPREDHIHELNPRMIHFGCCWATRQCLLMWDETVTLSSKQLPPALDGCDREWQPGWIGCGLVWAALPYKDNPHLPVQHLNLVVLRWRQPDAEEAPCFNVTSAIKI